LMLLPDPDVTAKAEQGARLRLLEARAEIGDLTFCRDHGAMQPFGEIEDDAGEVAQVARRIEVERLHALLTHQVLRAGDALLEFGGGDRHGRIRHWREPCQLGLERRTAYPDDHQRTSLARSRS